MSWRFTWIYNVSITLLVVLQVLIAIPPQAGRRRTGKEKCNDYRKYWCVFLPTNVPSSPGQVKQRPENVQIPQITEKIKKKTLYKKSVYSDHLFQDVSVEIIFHIEITRTPRLRSAFKANL